MFIDVMYEEKYNLIDVDDLIERLENITSKKYFFYKSIPTLYKENIEYKNYLTTSKDLVSVKRIFDGITALELKIENNFPVSISEKDIERNLDIVPIVLVKNFNNKIDYDELEPYLHFVDIKDLIFEASNQKNERINFSDDLNTKKNKKILSFLTEETVESVRNLTSSKYKKVNYAEKLFKFTIDKEDVNVHYSNILEYSGFVFITRDIEGKEGKELIVLNKENEEK